MPRLTYGGRMLGYLTEAGTAVHYTTDLVPPNAAPVAAFTSAVTDLSVTTDAATSSDTDGTIASYAWSWGDTATSTGVTAEHTYAAAGTYTVTLTVTDDDGATDTATADVDVTEPAPSNVAPTAGFTSDVDNLDVTFTSTSTDSDGTIASTAWDYGDGATGTGTPATHQYAAAGTYTVVLTVTDDDGATDTHATDVTVAGAAQTITLVGFSGLSVGTTTVAASYVAGATTDAILALAGTKPYSAVATSGSYNVLNEVTNGTTASGPSTGSVRCSAQRKTSVATGASSNTMTVTGGTVATCRTGRFATSVGTWASVAAFGMADTDSTGTTISATASPAAGTIQAGDMLVVHAVSTEDGTNHESRALTVDGCVLGTPTWLTKASTTTGDDMSTFTGYVHVLSGSSTGAVTYTATAGVSGASGTAVEVVVLRD